MYISFTDEVSVIGILLCLPHTQYLEVVMYCLLHTSTDIDECATGEDTCDDNADCEDTIGSYMCTCFSGFTGDGETCSDVNECLSSPCDANATCTNTNSSYVCECHGGFIGDGFLCTRKYMHTVHL